MFVLYEMTREVRIDPINLGQDRVDAIKDEINRKLSNRVMVNIGLCMALWDIRSISSALLYQGDGGAHSKVTFRYIVFRPFQDEIIMGKIKNCTPDGVHVTLGFFDDILIPPEALQYPSKFDEQEQIWIWEYKTEDDDEVHEMYMDKGESIKFRVTGEQFIDTTPIPSGNPVATSSTSQLPTSSSLTSQMSEKEESSPTIPYCITGSINEPGLGLLSWWS